MRLNRDGLGHILAAVGAHPAKLHAVIAWLFDLCYIDAGRVISIRGTGDELGEVLLGMADNGALLYLPSQKLAIDI